MWDRNPATVCRLLGPHRARQPEINRRIAEATALGRPGLPEDVGPMIAALLSAENCWVNAQRIEVSGGMMT